MRKLSNENGQALLLVLLGMAIVLTTVLSILSRSITDIAITSKEEEAYRAFSAAEAGVEKALIVGSSIGETTLGTAKFTAEVTNLAQGATEFAYPIEILAGESMVTWFVGHDSDGNLVCDGDNPCFTGDTLHVCWGKEGTGSSDAATPALEISIFYATTPGNYSTVRVARAAFDPNGGRRGTNKFAAPDSGNCEIEGMVYQFQKRINLASLDIPALSYLNQNGLQFASLKLFYNNLVSHPIGIDANFAGNSLLPAQGIQISSSGVSGEANRKINVFQSFGDIPSIFDSAVFSSGGIVK